MATSHRGASIRSDFEDVPDTVESGYAPLDDEDGVDEEASANPTLNASFDFLQALDSVSEQAGGASGGPSLGYSDSDFDPSAETSSEPATEPVADGGSVEVRETDVPRATAEGVAPMERDEGMPFRESCDPAALSTELGLREGMARAELHRLRRRFALGNHPDRLGPADRAIASRRMTIANSLIDAALRRARA